MYVAHRQLNFLRVESEQSVKRVFDQLMIERLFEPVLLRMDAAPRNTRGHRRIVEDRGEVETSRFPVLDRSLHVEHVDAADHLVDVSEAHFRHILTNLFCDVEEEI